MQTSSAPEIRSSRRELWVIALLVLSVVINYVDRTNLSLAAPLFQPELGISAVQLGSLLAAFSWTYAFLQLFGVSGWLVDRFPVGYVFLIGYVIWSGATLATGLLSGFTALFIARLVLGVGESIAYPSYSRVFATLPQHHRGRANAFIDAGTKLGPSAGALLGGVLMVHFGWRALFYVLGLGGMLWIVPWSIVMPRTRTSQSADAGARAGTIELLGVRAMWGTALGHFCGNYFYYFLMTWLPMYLVREAHMPVLAMTHVTAIAFLLVALSTVCIGWFSDFLIKRGVSATRVRKTAVFVGMMSASLVSALFIFPATSHVAVAILYIACTGYGAYCSNHWAITQTLAGPGMAGRWTGFQNGTANLSGIAGPWLAGAILQYSGSLRAAFLAAGLIAFAGALLWTLMVGRVEPVRWSGEAHPTNQDTGFTATKENLDVSSL